MKPWSVARQADAILLGAVGGPNVGPLFERGACGPDTRPVKIATAGSVRLICAQRFLSTDWLKPSTLKPEVVSGLDILDRYAN